MSNKNKRKQPAVEVVEEKIFHKKPANKKRMTKAQQVKEQLLINEYKEESHSEGSTMDPSEFMKYKQEKLLEIQSSKVNEEDSIASSSTLPSKDTSLDEQSKSKSKSTDNQTKNNDDSNDQIYQEISKPQEIFDCKYKPKEINFRDKEKNEIKNFLLRQYITSPFTMRFVYLFCQQQPNSKYIYY